MSKQISITLRQYVYDTYIRDFSGNKSAFIEENFIKGLEIETADNYKLKFIELTKQNRELEEQNKKLLAKIGRLEAAANPQEKLTPDNVFNDDELKQFAELLKSNELRRELMRQTASMLDRFGQDYFKPRYNLWCNETGETITEQDFNKKLVMYRKAVKRGLL